MYVCIYLCVCACMCTYVHMYVSVGACVSVYILYIKPNYTVTKINSIHLKSAFPPLVCIFTFIFQILIFYRIGANASLLPGSQIHFHLPRLVILFRICSLRRATYLLNSAIVAFPLNALLGRNTVHCCLLVTAGYNALCRINEIITIMNVLQVYCITFTNVCPNYLGKANGSVCGREHMLIDYVSNCVSSVIVVCIEREFIHLLNTSTQLLIIQ